MVPSSLKFDGWEAIASREADKAIASFDPRLAFKTLDAKIEWTKWMKPNPVLKALYDNHPHRGGPL